MLKQNFKKKKEMEKRKGKEEGGGEEKEESGEEGNKIHRNIDIKSLLPGIYLPGANLATSQRIYFKLLSVANGHNKHFEYKLCVCWL